MSNENTAYGTTCMFTKIIYYISSYLTCLQPSATPFSCTQKRGKCYQLNCDTLPIIKWIQFQKCKSVHLSTDKMWLYTVVSMYEMSSDQIQVNRNAQGLNILVYWISRQHSLTLFYYLLKRYWECRDGRYHSFTMQTPFLLCFSFASTILTFSEKQLFSWSKVGHVVILWTTWA